MSSFSLSAMLSNTLLLTLLSTAGAFASPLIRSSTPREQVASLPLGWSFHSLPTPTTPITLRFALDGPSDEITRLAQAVSDPKSDQYGKHLTKSDLQRVTRPEKDSPCSTIESWLRSNSINAISCDGAYARFTTSVATVERMLDTQFSYFQRGEEAPVLRTMQYTLPEQMAGIVSFAFPTVHFLSARQRPGSAQALQARQQIPSDSPDCTNSICPQNLTAMYNITYFPPDSSSGSKIGIAGFLDNYPNVTDVHEFYANYGLPNRTIPCFEISTLNNGTTAIPSSPDLLVEPNLDLDYSLAFTGPLPATFYSVGGRGVTLIQPGNTTAPPDKADNEPYLDFLEAILAEENPPQVVSMSYSDDEQSVPELYARHVCDLLAQAAARGISVIGSSGDGGAQGTGDSDCQGPDGQPRFIPTFPSSCPWITSVGAVGSSLGPASFSSGGFSNYFPTPDWQKNTTARYIQALNGSHAKYYNASGRGIPDVSVLGDDFLILAGGLAQTQKGTSASAPVFAAIVALLNDLQLRAGKSVLGHLNPLIYSGGLAAGFRDVISEFGTSQGCSTGQFTDGGWEALAGWDAATGLGEPDFEHLRQLLGV